MRENTEDEWIDIINQVASFKDSIIKQLLAHNKIIADSNVFFNNYSEELAKRLTNFEKENIALKRREDVIDGFLKRETDLGVHDIDAYITKLDYELTFEEIEKNLEDDEEESKWQK